MAKFKKQGDKSNLLVTQACVILLKPLQTISITTIILIILAVATIGLDRAELAERGDDDIRNDLNIIYSHRLQDTNNIYFYFSIHDFNYINNRYIEGTRYITTTLEKIEIQACLNELGRQCYQRIINSYDTLTLGDMEIVPVKAQLLTQARQVYTDQLALRDEARADERIINNFLTEGAPEHNIDVRQEE